MACMFSSFPNSWKVIDTIMKSVTVVLFAAFFQVKFSYGCDFRALSVCASMLSDSSDVMQSQGLAAIPSTQQLTSICGLLDHFRACYRPYLPKCQNNPYFTLTFGTIERTVDYLCEDGFKVILKYEACWNRSDVTNATKTCYNTQVRDIRRLEQVMRTLSHRQLSRRLCGILQEAQNCMRTSVDELCGSEAGTVIETIIKKTFVEIVLMMGCPSDHDDTRIFGRDRNEFTKGRYSHRTNSTSTGFSIKSKESSVILFVFPVWIIVCLAWN